MKMATTLFNSIAEVEAFGFKIGATHYVPFGNSKYAFLCELENKVPFLRRLDEDNNYHMVDVIYNLELKQWKPFDNVECMGLVAMCKTAVKIEMRLLTDEDY